MRASNITVDETSLSKIYNDACEYQTLVWTNASCRKTFADGPSEGSHECGRTLSVYIRSSRRAHAGARCSHRLSLLTYSFLACSCGDAQYFLLRLALLWPAALRFMFPNCMCFSADDGGLLWLFLIMDINLDETVSNFVRTAK